MFLRGRRHRRGARRAILEDLGDGAAAVGAAEVLDDKLLSERCLLKHVDVGLHGTLHDDADEEDTLLLGKKANKQ